MSGWLLSPGRDVYRRPNPTEKSGPLPWQQLVISRNALLDVPVAAGGRTALELQGFSHYVAASGSREAHLYINRKLPVWVSHLPVNTQLVFHNASKLFNNGDIPPYAGKTETVAPPPTTGAVTQLSWGHWTWPLPVSTPERAIFELLDEVPKRETFHQGMSSWRACAT